MKGNEPFINPTLGCALLVDAAGGAIVFWLLPLCGVDVPLWAALVTCAVLSVPVLAALFLATPSRANDTHEQRGE